MAAALRTPLSLGQGLVVVGMMMRGAAAARRTMAFHRWRATRTAEEAHSSLHTTMPHQHQKAQMKARMKAKTGLDDEMTHTTQPVGNRVGIFASTLSVLALQCQEAMCRLTYATRVAAPGLQGLHEMAVAAAATSVAGHHSQVAGAASRMTTWARRHSRRRSGEEGHDEWAAQATSKTAARASPALAVAFLRLYSQCGHRRRA